MPRKKYNKEFKTQVVKQVIEEGKKTTKISIYKRKLFKLRCYNYV